MAPKKTKQAIIKQIYITPGPGYLGSVGVLLKHAKEEDPAITRKDIELFLKKSHVYSITKGKSTSKQKFLKYVTTNVNEAWQADLFFIDRHPYLIIVDVFSFYIYVRKVKNKEPQNVLVGLKYIVEKEAKASPARIYSDYG